MSFFHEFLRKITTWLSASYSREPWLQQKFLLYGTYLLSIALLESLQMVDCSMGSRLLSHVGIHVPGLICSQPPQPSCSLLRNYCQQRWDKEATEVFIAFTTVYKFVPVAVETCVLDHWVTKLWNQNFSVWMFVFRFSLDIGLLLVCFCHFVSV